MPNRSDYEQLPQTEEHDGLDHDDYDQDVHGGALQGSVHLRESPASAGRPPSISGRSWRAGRPPKIDLSTLDSAFKRWTNEISKKVRRKKRSQEAASKKEIVFSVFQPAPAPFDIPDAPVKALDDQGPMTKQNFDDITTSVKVAILDSVHPKMITKGSSGSYFARGKTGSGHSYSTVGVFKPKDEEYGQLNPKTTKWIHRNFFWWVGWGRACLIPNLSYVSEAAASLLDSRLDLHIVPRTELVSLSSPAFSYGWIDRNAAKKGKPLPEKVGSFQTFLNGYQDASAFLRAHPWPGRSISDTYDESSHRTGAAFKRCSAALGILCGRVAGFEDDDDVHDQDISYDDSPSNTYSRPFTWTAPLQQEFREELEKLIILDYLMRNTDRGLDNFMIKYCEGKHQRNIVDVAPGISPAPQMPLPSTGANGAPASLSVPSSRILPTRSSSPHPPSSSSTYTDKPHIHIAAIDNSLSFPHQHPKGWRSFVYGWLFLPVSLIGRPFSESTRNHFLPLLSDPSWWSETTYQLRKLHEVDPDFNEKMFKRQMAVMKGQGWNIVQCLKHADEGPLELTRRTKVMVWDEEVEVPLDATPEELMECISAALSKLGLSQHGELVTETSAQQVAAQPTEVIDSIPGSPQPHGHSRRTRSFSTGGSMFDFPPLSPGRSTSPLHLSRPVPLSSKSFHGNAFGGATGVSVLEHLERLDEVEHRLERVIVDAGGVSGRQDAAEAVLFEADEEDEEADDETELLRHENRDQSISLHQGANGMSAPGGSQDHKPPKRHSRRSIDAFGSQPLDASFISTSTVPRTNKKRSRRTRPLKRDREMRVVIAERLETVDASPIFSGW